MLSLDKVYHASFVLKPVIRRTDLILAPNLCPGTEMYLKTENLQITGSFKVRGAYYKMSQLSEEERSHGVVACSAGNHAQGVALAAAQNGIPSLICLPAGAPISKVEATRRYGAQIEMVPGAYDDAYARALQLRDEKGYTFVHPFDDEEVIAGQGTIGLELMEQLPDADVVIVPIGGGGLCAGVAFAIKHLNPRCKVYGVQVAGAPSMRDALVNGHIETLPAVKTIADGIAVTRPGDLTYELIKQYVDDVVTVTDDEVATAILALIEQQKLITEGAGAVPVAAAMFGKVPIEGKKVICLLSGGNIDVTILSRVISRGLLKTGRSADITVALTDKPGQLSAVSKIVSDLGGNVVGVFHDRTELDADITGCYLRLILETRDQAHVDEIADAIEAAGYHIVSK